MMQRKANSSMVATSVALMILLTLGSASAFAQLDERWTVTINGQSAQVEPDGSFLLSNVSAPDAFGLGGPGTQPDFMSDDMYRLTGVRTTEFGTFYVNSNVAIRIKPGITVTFALGSLQVTLSPPPLPESIAVQVGCDPADPTNTMTCGSTFAVGSRRILTTTATLTDGTQQDVTHPADRTTYRTSNVNIARINLMSATTIDVEGVAPGVAFITATHGGATSVVRVTVASPGNLIFTTVEGFVRGRNDTPVCNASVVVQLPTTGPLGEPILQPAGTGATDLTGYFSISSDPLLNTTPTLLATATVAAGTTRQGSSIPVAPIPGGITDTGIITIDTVCYTPWSASFGPTTFEPTPLGALNIFALAFFDDDGDGPNQPALFVGGEFGTAGGTPISSVAKWDGTKYVPLAGGVSGNNRGASVNALAVLDLDGAGGDPPALYVAGHFDVAGGVPVTNIAKWDGDNWSALGRGVGDTSFSVVTTLAAYDDETGNGIELYAGGFFAVAGGLDSNRMCLPENGCVSAHGIARWNSRTRTWSAVGVGVEPGINNGLVIALAVFDNDGPGGAAPLLYVGGDFSASSTVPSDNIVKWDGTSWTGVGYAGLQGGPNDKVTSLAVFDDGSAAGPALYVGGGFIDPINFGTPDPLIVNLRNIARWNGASWSALGNSLDSEVAALAGLQDGNATFLYASGSFSDIDGGGGPGLRRVARWDGTAWLPLGNGIMSNGTALAVFDDCTESTLYVGGTVVDGIDCATGDAGVPGTRQGYVAKWNAPEWYALGDGLNDEVRAFALHDDGSGSALFAAGMFTPPKGPCIDSEAQLPSGGVARFDGSQWSSVGAGLDCPGSGCVALVKSLAVFDDDGAQLGPDHLFASVDYLDDGLVVANDLVRWDGIAWTSLAGGDVNGTVSAMAVFNDGVSSSALVVGGSFTAAGVTPTNRNGTALADNIAQWNGTNWTALGGGVTGGSVLAMAIFDDGSGPDLYVGGTFTNAGGVSGTGFIARWDGFAWSAVGGGVTATVHVLTAGDVGMGPALYVGGRFLLAGGNVTVNRIARWNGVAWSAMSVGLGPASGIAKVDALAVLDDGQSSTLYAGGDFTTALTQSGSVFPLNRLAKWNSTLGKWSAVGVSSQLGGGVDGTGTVAIQALAVFDDGFNGPALFAGGLFETASGVPSSNIAKLGCR